MMEGKRIAVVIPAFRVAGQIGEVIGIIPTEVDAIFVVDDASPDDLAERIKATPDRRLTLLRHDENRGVGSATVTGMAAAIQEGFDIVVKCDGDGQMNPQDIPYLVRPLLDEVADHVKGTRFHHFRELESMPKWRFLGNVGLTFLTKLSSGYWNVLDPVNGFLATRRETLQRLPLSHLAKRYFFEIDLLIRLNIIEARVAEVPFPARYGDEPSSLSPWRTLVTFPVQLAAGLARRIFWRYVFHDVSPVAVFGITGFAFCLFGLLFGSYHWAKNSALGVVTPVGTVMLAVLPLILGFQLILQAVGLDIQNTPKPGSKKKDAQGGVSETTARPESAGTLEGRPANPHADGG
ncbi:MAG: glycosyltransferase family 2 protein [Acidobacteriota bacterium]